MPPRAALAALIAAALACSHAAGAGTPSLSLSVDERTGSFSIALDGKRWLVGHEYRVGTASALNSTLHLRSSSRFRGADNLGHFSATRLNWAEKSDTTVMSTTFREYDEDDGFVVFEQHFPKEVNLKAVSGGQTLSAGTVFPSFARNIGGRDLPCFAYHGVFPALKQCTVNNYTSSVLGGVPLVIFDDQAEDLPMLVMSPLSDPMAQQMTGENRYWFGAGVKGTVEIIPAGWTQQFIVSAGMGINDGFMAWGSRVLKFTGRPVVDNRYKDDVHGSIGFWTDNGGFYHYSIGTNVSLGKTYEEVLPKVTAYHDELGVPFKHWQFDSWFYPKDGAVSPGGGGGAVTNWTSMPSVFPHGMAYIQSKLKVPIVMHNRQWSITSDYIKNWPEIEWYVSDKAAVPKDPEAFFKRFFTEQGGWGLAMYEQDWMNDEYLSVDALRTNISMGDLWLRGMAAGATSSGRTIQFCMPYPSQVLAASYLPAVTNVRATGDYFHAVNQWAIGNTALFYWALNILPFKDGFYSSTNKQVGGQTEGPELNPDREALMATLSTAMVGPMDGIYLLNATRVMTTCRKDGAILKPDRPLTTTDQCFRERNADCHVFHTVSDVSGWQRVHYYFSDDGTKPLRMSEVYLKHGAEYSVYNWYTGELTLLSETNVLKPGYEGHIYAVVTPVVKGWILLGEVGKYVTVSTLRFRSVAVKGYDLTAQVHGVTGETVHVCAAESRTLHVVCIDVHFDVEATQAVSFSASEVPELV